IDAIPNAGRYDGVVGILGALEAIRTLQRAGFKPQRSIELIVFTAEEPTRFGIGCPGSRLLSGTLSAARVPALRAPDGQDLACWLNPARLPATHGARLSSSGALSATDAAAFVKEIKLPRDCYSAFVELHIEQGPILEQESIPIGVVEKIAAPSTLRLQLTGV